MCRHPNSLAPSEPLVVTTVTPLFFLFNLLPCTSLHRNPLSYLESPLLLLQLLGSQQIYLTWNEVDNYFSDNLCRRCADGRVREKHVGQCVISIWSRGCMSLWFDLEWGIMKCFLVQLVLGCKIESQLLLRMATSVILHMVGRLGVKICWPEAGFESNSLAPKGNCNCAFSKAILPYYPILPYSVDLAEMASPPSCRKWSVLCEESALAVLWDEDSQGGIS